MGEFEPALTSLNQAFLAALRSAQLEMWQTQQWNYPYYWAAFTLQGEWK
ncbi:MAG: CHAT domain-containing protein [Lyngbya sp.]|nr:CHAT domain-containing protein [Lyngbya sp.]